ncbi:MAG: S49 family peptidase [Rhodospirillaceae bacterium]|nr:S49 family peptidase [Rhodospirillaceae bacterium]
MRLLRSLGRIVLFCLAFAGAATLLLAGVVVFALGRTEIEPLPERMVLKLDLKGKPGEAASDNPLARLGGLSGPTLGEITRGLDRAARDKRVQGVVVRLDGAELGMAQAQELRDAVHAFRASGKKAAVFATALGETGSGTVPYYAASAFDTVWLQPSGLVGLTGFMAQSPFLKNILERIGVSPEFAARWEYKSYIEMFTRKQYSPAARESLDRLLDSWSRQAVAGIAADRSISPEQVTALIDRAPLLAGEAEAGGLVDRLAYWDELEDSLKADGNEIVDFARYAGRLTSEKDAHPVALIVGVGPVQDRDSPVSPFEDGVAFSAERMARAFREAIEDPSVKAILLRIDSPGGSYTASDSIRREVIRARAAGKTVVVSMGDVAASGGYFAAMGADWIVAQPGTITGSIGVFTGKMVLNGLWEKLGVDWDKVQKGRNADIWSANEPFSPAGWERVNAILDHIYADFTTKASADRKLVPEAMDAVARGRIWAGAEARKVGLVDELGGIDTALASLRRLRGWNAGTPVDLVAFPRPKTPLAYVQETLQGGGFAETMIGIVRGGRLLDALAPLAGLLPPESNEALRMPPVTAR